MIPKAVVFDLGKVLVDFDYQIVSDKIACKAKIPAAEVRKLLDHAPLLYRFETGLLTNEEFYKEVCSCTGFAGEFEEFCVTFGDIFTEIWPMIEFQAALRQKGIPTYIFSNTNELAIRHIRKRFPFFAHFTGYIYSYEHGSMKPDARIYEVVEKQTGLTGAAILYLDDRAENVAAGAVRGWQTIVHRCPKETLALVAKLGLPA